MLRYLSKFLYILEGKKNKLLILLLFFVTTSTLDAIGIGLVGPFISLASAPDSVVQNPWINWAYVRSGVHSTIYFVALLGVVIIVVFYIKSFLYFRVQEHIYEFSLNQQGELRVRLLHAYLAVPYIFHLNRNTALLIQNIINETQKYSYGVMIPILTSVANIVVLLLLVLLLAKTDFLATVIVSGVLLLVFLLYYQFRGRMAYWGKESSKSNVEMIRIVNHSLGGLKETRVIGCEPYFENQISLQAKRHAIAASSFHAFKLLPRILIEAILVTFLVCLTATFLIFNRSTQDLTSLLSIFALAAIRLMPSISQLMSNIAMLKNSSYSLDKLYFDFKELEKLKKAGSLESSTSSNSIGVLSSEHTDNRVMPYVNQIVLDKINYRYPESSETALKDISLNIKKGQSIALIGKSGAGKTTLVDVILGLLAPESGDIRVDDVSIYNNIRSWQNLIGYIPQSIFIMDDTIEKNIAFGVPDHLIDPQRLNKAIQTAQLTELVEQLPDGVKTTVGERGVRLSGGQRQRIGIARALYHEREILVLDEATAALDNETESLVNEALKSLSGTKTMIIIAHRLTTVEHCDCIYMMEQGRVIKSGTYQEVVLGEQTTQSH